MACVSAILEDPQTARVVALLRAGQTLDQVSQQLGLHRSAVYRRKVAAGLPRRWRPLTVAERRAIRALLAADYSRRQVAAMVGRGLGTVARLAGRGGVVHRATRSAYRCPGCGYLIHVTPCVICLSRGVRPPCPSAPRD